MANELYRQAIHLVGGVVIAFAAFFFSRAVFLWITGTALALVLLLILFFAPELKWVYAILEREHTAFLGKGALFFILGIFLVALLFWEQAPFAILMLSVPDATATVVGTLFHSPHLPYNRRKTVFGSAAFFVSAALVLSIRYPVIAVFFIAFLLTALESFDYREIPFLDDNLVIPLVTGYLLSLV